MVKEKPTQKKISPKKKLTKKEFDESLKILKTGIVKSVVKKKKRKKNRPNSVLKERFLIYFRELPIQRLAAGVIGKHEDTITDWKKADKKFSDDIEAAKSEWALKTSKYVKSGEWLLERIMSEHFKEKKEVQIDSSEALDQFLDRAAIILSK